MYTPRHFAADDLPRLWDAIERYSFAVLASQDEGELVASHLPLLLDRALGPRGTLLGHLARANPQWEGAAGQEVLVIFSGPHAYISPAWYAAERVVPTWNYVAVHAYGKLELMDDIETSSLLTRMVEHFETPLPQPWQLAGQPADFIEQLAQQIVGFRIPIDRLEGKWKLNQNQPAERRERVVAALESQGSADAAAVADLMRKQLPGG